MLLTHSFPLEKSESGVISHAQKLALQGEITFGHCFVVQFDERINSLEHLLFLIDGVFYHHPSIQHIQLPRSQWHASQAWQGLIDVFDSESFSRFEFYANPINGLKEQTRALFTERFEDRACPTRPVNLSGEVYRRFNQDIGKFISFKVADPLADLDVFHTWMHNPRVSKFWEQDWSKEKLQSYLANKLHTPFNLPLIGYFDDQAFGYFEVYWAGEDRIAPYYPWQAHDRGLHLLVGNEAFRGSRYFKAWCTAISHFIFLDCPQTQKIVLEPRHDNQRLLNQITKLGFIKEYEFEFPHKRAALVSIEKVKFYKENFQC